MKNVMLMISFIFTANLAHAGQAYQCNLIPSSGTALVVIDQNSPDQYVIKMKLRNHYNAEGGSVREDYEGRFNVRTVQSSDNYIKGKGVFKGQITGAHIPAELSGPIKPNPVDGHISFSIHTRDERIENGYGLWFSCKPLIKVD